MDTNDQDILEEQTAPPRKRKKKKSWIIVLVIVILAAALGTGYYFMERQKPISTARNYLDDIKAMNFDGMKELLQSNDMTALDNADITNDAYALPQLLHILSTLTVPTFIRQPSLNL